MKRLLTGLAVAALFTVPAAAQPVSRADIIAFCLTAPGNACAAQLQVYLNTLPAAERVAAYNAINAELADAGVVVALAPPVVVTNAAPRFAGLGAGAASGGGADSPARTPASPN
jgi:hypothetical protein